jgi:hypothetical protein
MERENFGTPGMPPIWYDVLHRQTEQKRGVTIEVTWVSGFHPHLGKLHHGWSGPETIVRREIRGSAVRLLH